MYVQCNHTDADVCTQTHKSDKGIIRDGDHLAIKLDESSAEKEHMAQEVIDFLNNKDKRLELETLTPHVLKDSGEVKFRAVAPRSVLMLCHRFVRRSA